MTIVGIESRGMPSEHDEDGCDYKAVLVEDGFGDVACYLGVGRAEWVASHGDKVSLQEACVYFPGLTVSLETTSRKYRR